MSEDRRCGFMKREERVMVKDVFGCIRLALKTSWAEPLA